MRAPSFIHSAKLASADRAAGRRTATRHISQTSATIPRLGLATNSWPQAPHVASAGNGTRAIQSQPPHPPSHTHTHTLCLHTHVTCLKLPTQPVSGSCRPATPTVTLLLYALLSDSSSSSPSLAASASSFQKTLLSDEAALKPLNSQGCSSQWLLHSPLSQGSMDLKKHFMFV